MKADDFVVVPARDTDEGDEEDERMALMRNENRRLLVEGSDEGEVAGPGIEMMDLHGRTTRGTTGVEGLSVVNEHVAPGSPVRVEM